MLVVVALYRVRQNNRPTTPAQSGAFDESRDFYMRTCVWVFWNIFVICMRPPPLGATMQSCTERLLTHAVNLLTPTVAIWVQL